MDRLAIRQDDDDQQDGDDDGDRNEGVEGGGAGTRLDQQDDEDLVSRVRRRRHRVGGEDGERDPLAQTVVPLVTGRDRTADQQALQELEHRSFFVRGAATPPTCR